MKRLAIAVLVLSLACVREKPKAVIGDRFANSMVNIEKIGKLSRLTQDGRCIYPRFASGDSIIFFKRLLITDPADTFAYSKDQFFKSYGINVSSGELYTLSAEYSYRGPQKVDISKAPRHYSEEAIWGLSSPDSNVMAFETISKGKDEVHQIYIARGDSVAQLSYGGVSCFLDRFSNTGRYLTAIYGDGPTWVMVFDLKSNIAYRIERIGDYIDYMTNFSSDDKMMIFVRSDGKYMAGRDYFGDIWLVKFDGARE